MNFVSTYNLWQEVFVIWVDPRIAQWSYYKGKISNIIIVASETISENYIVNNDTILRDKEDIFLSIEEAEQECEKRNKIN